LPFLEALRPAVSLAAGSSAAPTAPLRMAFIYVPNGVHVPDWTPKRVGALGELPYILQPLAPVKDDILVLSRLGHDKGRANGDGPGDHARAASTFLTGAQPFKTQGANIRVGASVDQLVAEKLGKATRFASLELSCDGGTNSGNCDSGYSCAYSNNISWKSPTTPAGKEVDPRRLFDRLFASGSPRETAEVRQRRQARRLSVLDFVLEDARKLQAEVGGADRRKLDEYFTSLRDLELRVASASRVGPADFAAPPNLPAEAGGRSEHRLEHRLEHEVHIALHSDLLALAFQADLTRVATFMYARAGSNRNYRNIGVADGHHDLSHHQGDPAKHAKIREIDRFHIAHLSRFLQKLKSVPEGEGTLLDNCMIVYGSGLGDGNRHNHDDLPIILAGRGGGTIDTGRHLEYERETPLCNLFLSMLDRAGIHEERFSDSTGRLPNLSA
jgi:hypothetical protein